MHLPGSPEQRLCCYSRIIAVVGYSVGPSFGERWASEAPSWWLPQAHHRNEEQSVSDVVHQSVSMIFPAMHCIARRWTHWSCYNPEVGPLFCASLSLAAAFQDMEAAYKVLDCYTSASAQGRCERFVAKPSARCVRRLIDMPSRQGFREQRNIDT